MRWSVGLIILCVLVSATQLFAEEHEDLENAMKAMNRPYKALLKQVNDKARNADSLKLLTDLQAATLRSKGIMPDHLPGKTKEERDKAAVDYRASMAACLIAELEAEQALLDNHNDTAAKKLDELKSMMETGHKEFRKEHEH